MFRFFQNKEELKLPSQKPLFTLWNSQSNTQISQNSIVEESKNQKDRDSASILEAEASLGVSKLNLETLKTPNSEDAPKESSNLCCNLFLNFK